MNHQISPNGQSPRVADYFAIVGTSDELIPVSSADISRQSASSNHSSSSKPVRLFFECAVTDRYPVLDRRDLAFPTGVPLFCFPNGLEISSESKSPSFFSFVQTSESGAHILGCCLVIYEPITPAQRKNLNKYLEERNEAVLESTRLLVPKCLCLISTWPFIDAFKKILCQFYRISLSPSFIPIERYICNFLDDVPAPPPGRVSPFHFIFCLIY